MHPLKYVQFGMIFKPAVTAGIQPFAASVCASRYGRRISDLWSGRSVRGPLPPESLVEFEVPGRTPPSTLCRGRLHTALRYASSVHPAHLPLRERRPQPHAANWRLPPTRLELTMFMLSLSSTISEICLTVQKPTVRTYRIKKTLPQFSKSTFGSKVPGTTHALDRADITCVGTPCIIF
jgi:hypothetical protein